MSTQTMDAMCRVMVERSPYGVFLADMNGRCLHVNDAACRLAGRSREELLGLSIWDLLPADRQDAGQDHFRRLREDGAAHGEVPYLRPDGSRRWWSVDAVAMGEDRFLGYVIDITDRNDLLDGLERERARLRRAGEVARVGWWEIDLATGMVTASDHAHEIYGVAHDDDLSLAAIQKIPLPEHRDDLDRALADLIAGRGAYDVRYRIRRPRDGALVDVRSLAEFDRDRNRIFGILQDITDYVRAEQALRESETRLRAIFDAASDYIFLKDRELRYTHVNPACQDFFQRPLDEIIGRQDHDLFSARYVREIEAVDRRVLAGQTHRGVVERQFRGQTVFLETIKVAVRDQTGAVVGLCGFSRDITDVRRLEEQLRQAQKMEAVGRLAGGVAHDFNNLLTPILGFTDLLVHSSSIDETARKDLQAVVRAAERARDLTAQLLAFGRKQLLDMQVIDVNAVIQESETMLRRLLPENIRLDLVLAPDLAMTRADASQLHNVLINLAVNAADAMRDGGVLTIETQNVVLDEEYALTHPGSLPGPHVLMAVNDSGCGMDAETLPMIFEPFFTTKLTDTGTGLGLATVHGIVKQHQGSIQVYSEPGHGTQFKVYLPRVAGDPAPRCDSPDPRPLHGAEQILLVEDDEAVRNLAVTALAKYGYHALPMASPAAALEFAAGRDQPCDLLLTDVVMPGMNGARLHRKLQEIWPDLPVLFMSGYTSNVIAHHGILADGLHFLQKPFTPQDLAAKVREVLDG